MNDAHDIETIAAECIDAVLRGEASIEACAARYPAQADELLPVLRVAVLTARLKQPEMPAAAADALEMRLRGALPGRDGGRFGPRHAPALARLAAVLAVVLFIGMGGAGAVAASSDSLPGDPLYSIKRLWESVVVALSPLTGDLDELWLHIVGSRLAEIERLAAVGRLTDAALADLHHALGQAIAHADADTEAALAARLAQVDSTLTALPASPMRDQVLALADPGPAADPAPALITATPTETPAPTETAIPPASVTPSPTLTPTPRLPATATHTATFTITPRLPRPPEPPSATPTATLTPLPLPGEVDGWGIEPSPTTGIYRPEPTPIPPTIDPQATIRLRETERAVYATQTAEPPATSGP